MATIFIYSTSTGMAPIVSKTERAQALIDGNGGRGRTEIVFLDIEQEKRAQVWEVSKKKGIYPLVFVGDRFVGPSSTLPTRTMPFDIRLFFVLIFLRNLKS